MIVSAASYLLSFCLKSSVGLNLLLILSCPPLSLVIGSSFLLHLKTTKHNNCWSINHTNGECVGVGGWGGGCLPICRSVWEINRRRAADCRLQNKLRSSKIGTQQVYVVGGKHYDTVLLPAPTGRGRNVASKRILSVETTLQRSPAPMGRGRNSASERWPRFPQSGTPQVRQRSVHKSVYGYTLC